MKKQNLFGLTVTGMFLITAMTACGSEENLGSTETANQIQKEEAVALSGNNDKKVPLVKLPDGITPIQAESVPNQEVASLIIDSLEIPEEDWKNTRYYYNYVDLNEDGKDEIFVMVTGPYTSGTGGSMALYLTGEKGNLTVAQKFTVVNEPVIISNEVENGYHVLVIPYNYLGKQIYSVLKYQNGAYPNTPNGQEIENLDGITGTAIIANDRSAEADNGIEWMNLKDN